MANSPSNTDSSEEGTFTLLKLLNAVEADSNITQRSAAREMGVALGLANAYVKRCVRKGWIKIHQVPTNRYTYYLTPKGFAEKSRLTAEYLNQGFKFFRVSMTELDSIYMQCESYGWVNVALYGLTDLTEIAVMEARRHRVTIAAIVDPLSDKKDQDGVSIVAGIDDAPSFDAIIITDTVNPQDSFDRLCRTIDAERVMTPAILQISRKSPDIRLAMK